jgi:hypothetical protein
MVWPPARAVACMKEVQRVVVDLLSVDLVRSVWSGCESVTRGRDPAMPGRSRNIWDEES